MPGRRRVSPHPPAPSPISRPPEPRERGRTTLVLAFLPLSRRGEGGRWERGPGGEDSGERGSVGVDAPLTLYFPGGGATGGGVSVVGLDSGSVPGACGWSGADAWPWLGSGVDVVSAPSAPGAPGEG